MKEFKFNSTQLYQSINSDNVDLIHDYQLQLPTPTGEKVFQLNEFLIGDKRIPHLFTFRGISSDQKTRITITIQPKSMNASLLENGRSFFIEPQKGKKYRYILYYSKGYKNQSNDFIK